MNKFLIQSWVGDKILPEHPFELLLKNKEKPGVKMIVEYAANEGEIFTEGIFYPLVGLGVLPEPILQNRTTRVPLNLFENVMKTKFFYGEKYGKSVLLKFENLKNFC